jgi:hypothetical protein
VKNSLKIQRNDPGPPDVVHRRIRAMVNTVFEENKLEIENGIQNGVELDAADADAPRNATPAAIGSDSLHGALSDF